MWMVRKMEKHKLPTMLTTVLGCLLILINIQLTYGQQTTFVVALLGQRLQNETFDDTINYKFVLSSSGVESTVNISDVGGQIEILTVPSSGAEIAFNETRALNGSEYNNKTIILQGDNPFELRVFAETSSHVEGFLGIAIEDMNRSSSSSSPFTAYDYLVTTFCDIGGYCQLAVAALEDDTTVSIELPSHVEDIVFCIGKLFFNSASSKVITLKKYDSFQLETTYDLTGTHIFSFKPISVFAGSRSVDNDGVVVHTMEQLFPTWHWGTKHIVSSLGDTSYGDILKITGAHYNTEIKMSGFNPFIIEAPYHVVSRRLSKGTISYIEASTPIQVVQISGLKYAVNSTTEVSALSMTVVPSLHNIVENGVHTYCTNPSMKTLTQDKTLETYDDVKYTKYRIGTTTGGTVTTGEMATVIKCHITATLPASYNFIPPTEGSEDIISPTHVPFKDGPNGMCYDGGRSTVVFDQHASVATPTRINLIDDGYKIINGHILKLRMRFCGEAVLQFFTSMGSLDSSLLVRISYGAITFTSCTEPNSCKTKTKQDTNNFNQGSELNCEIDMAFFWFWQNVTGPPNSMCAGFGDNVNLETDCSDSFVTNSNHYTYVTVMGLFVDAQFNWDFQDPTGCTLYEERWRCFDRWANCSSYGTTFCNDPANDGFARNLCSKYCGRCFADSYGRKFIVKLPIGVHTDHTLIVSAVNAHTGVAVLHKGASQTSNVPVNKFDDYTRSYILQDTFYSDTYIVITDDEVSVTVLLKIDIKTISYPVMPVDTFGYEYVVLDNDYEVGSEDNTICPPLRTCLFASEYSYSDASLYFYSHANLKVHATIYSSSGPLVQDKILKTTNNQPLSGTVFNFNKPVGVFCGLNYIRVMPCKQYDSFNQILPLNTWSTEYYVPAFDPINSYVDLHVELYVLTNTDNTIVNISGGFDGTYPIFERGDVIFIPIATSGEYHITASEKIAVAIYFHNVDNTSSAFHFLTPRSDMHEVNVQSIPNNMWKEYNGEEGAVDISSYFITDGFSSTHTEKDASDVGDFYRYVSVDTQKNGFTIVSQPSGAFFVVASPRKIRAKSSFDIRSTCRVTTDNVADSIDGDCDRLIDEEDCFQHLYGVYRQDSDLDGGFGEDCGVTQPGVVAVEKPIAPVCFVIDKPAGQCWAPCYCPCEKMKELELIKNLTQEQLAATLSDKNEQLQSELQVDVVELSATTGQRKSKGDERKSAASIGYVGIAIFCIVFGAIIILDFGSLVRDARILIANLNDGFDRVFGC